jgi:hypothetical protein
MAFETRPGRTARIIPGSVGRRNRQRVRTGGQLARRNPGVTPAHFQRTISVGGVEPLPQEVGGLLARVAVGSPPRQDVAAIKSEAQPASSSSV